MFQIGSTGDFKNTEKFLDKMSRNDYIFSILQRHALEGMLALRSATPVDSGLTADSWEAKVSETPTGYSIEWHNRHVVSGVPVVILLQYGHGTGTGGYVEGIDFINPAIRPIFDSISKNVWKVVTSA